MTQDLGTTQPVHGRWVAPHLLDVVLHPRPRRGQHPVAPRFEAVLPTFPAPRCEPEAVDQDDRRGRGRVSHGVSYTVASAANATPAAEIDASPLAGPIPPEGGHPMTDAF